MSEHIAIGAVYAKAWALFRQHFILLVLLNILQTAGLLIGLFRRELVPRLVIPLYHGTFDSFVQVIYPASVFGFLLVGIILFLLASTGMVLVMSTGCTTKSSIVWGSLLRRFIPVLLSVGLCFAILAFILYGWVSIIDSVWRYVMNRAVLLGFTLVVLVALSAVGAIFFVTLPAAALEGGSPFKAISRSFFLTKGQRSRIAAIIAMLLLALVTAFVGSRMAMFALRITHDLPIELELVITFGVNYGVFLLVLTVVIMATYQQLVRLKDGISAEDAGKVFE